MRVLWQIHTHIHTNIKKIRKKRERSTGTPSPEPTAGGSTTTERLKRLETQAEVCTVLVEATQSPGFAPQNFRN